MTKVMKVIEPIIYDLKDGSLKRVRKSNYKQRNQNFGESIQTSMAFQTEDGNLIEGQSSSQWNNDTSIGQRMKKQKSMPAGRTSSVIQSNDSPSENSDEDEDPDKMDDDNVTVKSKQ